jgi:hypothetical protein
LFGLEGGGGDLGVDTGFGCGGAGAQAPGVFWIALPARLKPCPSGAGSYGTAEAVPFRSRPADCETAAGALEGDYGDSEPSAQNDGGEVLFFMAAEMSNPMVDAMKQRRTWGTRILGHPASGWTGDLYWSLALLMFGCALFGCAWTCKINGHTTDFAGVRRSGGREVKVGSRA